MFRKVRWDDMEAWRPVRLLPQSRGLDGGLDKKGGREKGSESGSTWKIDQIC